MQRDVLTAHLPDKAHFPHYRYGLAPYPYIPTHGHYPPHPYPYGGYEPPYLATGTGTRECPSPSPIHCCSKDRSKPDAQGHHGTQPISSVSLDVDPHTPMWMTPTNAATGLAEDSEDVPILHVHRCKTTVELPPDIVNFKSQPPVLVPLVLICGPSMLDIGFLMWRTI